MNAGLPPPVRQHEVRDDNGKLIARLDLAYPEARVAIEADGYRWHAGRHQWERDLRRRNALGALGWTVLHATSSDAGRRAAWFVARVRGVLGG